jgi:hypothetical protein
MGISAGGGSIAEVRVAGLTATRGVGFSRLVFSLALNVTPKQKDSSSILINNPVCDVWVGTARSESQSDLSLLGVATPDSCWHTYTLDYPSTDGFSLFLDLSGERLAALEQLRAGRSLFFRLNLHVTTHPKSGLHRSLDIVWFEANPSLWSKVLHDFGFLDVLLLGIELPTKDVPSKLTGVVKQIQDAHGDLIAGRYDGVVARVRLALEAIEKITGMEQPDAAARLAFVERGTREAMPKSMRRDFVHAAIRNYAHLAHHPDSSGKPEHFSRHDAMFILSAAAALIWDVIGAMLRDDLSTS